MGNSKVFKPKRARKGKISFDVEVINKGQAEKLLSEQDTSAENTQIEKNDAVEHVINKNVSKKRKQSEKETKNMDNFKAKKKKSMEKQAVTETKTTTAETEPVEGQDVVNQPKKESVRARKRKKHLKLMEERKLNSDLQLQQKGLNYLSKWKHSKSEWKFEKLKQVWIQQSLLDSSKIPNEFWATALEYFSGTKGSSRQSALDEAIKVIEAEGENSEEQSEEYRVKLSRARDIVQNLQ